MVDEPRDPITMIGVSNPTDAMQFADGGVIPDALDQTTETGSQTDAVSDRVNRALALVDQALMYGRQKYGLDKQQNQAGAQGQDADGDNDGDTGSDDSDGVIPTQSFAEGGAVEEDPADDPADDPMIPEQQPMPENSEQGQQAAAQQSTQPTVGEPAEFNKEPAAASGLEAKGVLPHQLLQKVGRSLMDYIRGTDAAPVQEVSAAEEVAKKEHPNNRGAQKLAAVDIGSQGDPQKAFAYIQANRKAFDASKGFAANALDKQNLASAADAATKAYDHVLDGTDVKFTPTPRADGGVAGVTVTVKPLNGQATQSQLTIPQFREWLMGKPGQLDNIYQNGTTASLKQAASTPSAQQPRGTAPSQPIRGATAPGAGAGDMTPEVQKAYNQANAIAQRLAPGTASGERRLAIVTQMMNDYFKHNSALEVAKAQGESRGNVAEIAAGSRERVGAGHDTTTLQKTETQQTGGNTRMGMKVKSAEEIARENRAAQVKRDEYRETEKNYRSNSTNKPSQVDPSRAQRVPQPAQQAAQSQQQAPQTKLVNGKWYKRGPNGEAIEVQGPAQ